MNSVMDLTLKFLYLLGVKIPHLSLKWVLSQDDHKNTQNDHKICFHAWSKISTLEMNSIMDFIFAVLYAV